MQIYEVFVPTMSHVIYRVKAENVDDAKEQVSSGAVEIFDQREFEEDLDINNWFVEELEEREGIS